jgi:hypothetical protein
MSQAWLFLGVAIRMAQDLGLHRSVDKFHAVASHLFPTAEKEARNRVWWGCVIMDRWESNGFVLCPLTLSSQVRVDVYWPTLYDI